MHCRIWARLPKFTATRYLGWRYSTVLGATSLRFESGLTCVPVHITLCMWYPSASLRVWAFEVEGGERPKVQFNVKRVARRVANSSIEDRYVHHCFTVSARSDAALVRDICWPLWYVAPLYFGQFNYTDDYMACIGQPIKWTCVYKTEMFISICAKRLENM